MAQEQKKTDVVSRLRRGEKVGQAPVEASTPEMTADMQSKAFGFNVAARLAETRAPNAKAQASPEVVARADEAVQHAVEQSGLFNPPGEEAAEEPIPEVVEEATETPAGAPSSSRKRGRPPKTSQALEPVALDTHRLMAGRISVGLIRARLFNPTDPGYIDRIAHLSVEIAEKIDQILMSK